MRDYVRIMDGDGTYKHYLYPGGPLEQPFLVMEILDIIKAKWNELRNKEQADGIKGKHRNKR
ncbi:MAG: hypothetical protein ACQ5SW_00860 [Sphaerochaetaceae bacterium]